jgi:thioesterase domain-containing protein
LSEIWADVLGVEKIGVQHSFFEVGGHSLLAIRLLAQVREECEVDLPVRALFEAPTIAAMAASVERARANRTCEKGPTRQAEGVLVPIQPKGTKRPFFCVAPASGVVFPYYHIASLFSPDRPFYGLQDPRLSGDGMDIGGLEALARHYVAAIQDAQSQGPYLLGGWSFGGMVAFEVARQLTEQGEHVAFLGLFDCTPDRRRKAQLWNLPRLLARGVQATARALTYLRNSTPYIRDGLYLIASRAKARHNARTSMLDYASWVIADRVYRRLLSRADVPNVMSRSERARLRNIPGARRVFVTLGANMREYSKYVLKSYPGRVTLFYPQNDSEPRTGDLGADAWGRYAGGGVDCHPVSGNHAALFAPPYVQGLAEQLKCCIESAEQRCAGSLALGRAGDQARLPPYVSR